MDPNQCLSKLHTLKDLVSKTVQSPLMVTRKRTRASIQMDACSEVRAVSLFSRGHRTQVLSNVKWVFFTFMLLTLMFSFSSPLRCTSFYFRFLSVQCKTSTSEYTVSSVDPEARDVKRSTIARTKCYYKWSSPFYMAQLALTLKFASDYQ